MLRDVVGTFLDTLTEREFDGPLLAILSSQGFTDIHFIHGAFEFGKDVIAKKTDSVSGLSTQYVVQSKAGDMGMPEWRAVRPQLEECEYNTLGHPSFDAALPRVAVLVLTGRLKGSAPSDVVEYRRSVESRGLAGLEIWDRSNLIDWLLSDPVTGITGESMSVDFMSILASIGDSTVSDRRIESYTRRWLPTSEAASRRASIEAAVLINSLIRVRRLDLALNVAIQLLRATTAAAGEKETFSKSAKRLILNLTSQLLDQIEPLLSDPLDLARGTISQPGQLTYLVMCCRISEAFAIGMVLAGSMGNAPLNSRFRTALQGIVEQPGSARPPGDLFAASVILTTVALRLVDKDGAIRYIVRVAKWLLDRHDDEFWGLGLASLIEDEQTTATRLFGGALEGTTLERRRSSYLGTAVLDLALFLGLEDLYTTLLANYRALQIVAETTNADERKAHWSRGGPDVWPIPNIEYEEWYVQTSRPGTISPEDAETSFLLTAACRSRHYRAQWGDIQ